MKASTGLMRSIWRYHGGVIAAATLAVTAVLGVTSAQEMPNGGTYILHSAAQGDCPALDWHVVVDVDGSVAGMISWNEMRSMAQVTGVVRRNARTFQATARELGGERGVATVEGHVSDDGSLVATIKGPHVDCQDIKVPLSPKG
jgi:hypothetical protein